MHKPEISLVVPTYNRRDSVRRLLEALERQSMQPELFEVLVVMDGSEDGTDELLAAMKPPFRLRGLWQANQGRATACNAGIRGAQGELIVLLDDDMQPAPLFLSAHQEAHRGQDSLGILGAVPVVVTPQSPPVTAYMAQKFEQHLQKISQPGYQLNLRDFYSGNFSIRQQALLDTGLFDEHFKIYGNEDLELSLRLRRAGVSLRYCGQALAYQYYEKDFNALAHDNIAKGSTAVLFSRMYPEIYSELKLSSYNEASPKWRLLRATLLQLSGIWQTTPEHIVSFMRWLEQKRPARLNLYYQLALDYFFWWGVKNEP